MEYQYQKLDHPEVCSILFLPRVDSPVPESANVLVHRVEVEENIAIEVRFHIADPDRPHIIFFHGNGEIAADYDEIAQSYIKRNISFIAVDYRAYGSSDGSPTASSMMSDCHGIYKYVTEWMRNEERNAPVVLMGRSLGCASAIELAATHKQEIAALVIDSGFAQTLPLLLTLGVDANGLGITEHDGFKNVRKIMTIAKPSLFLHGQFDEIIPVASAEILQAQSAARSKQFQMVPGADHNNILEKVGEMYFDVISQFIDKAIKARPKRRRSGIR